MQKVRLHVHVEYHVGIQQFERWIWGEGGAFCGFFIADILRELRMLRELNGRASMQQTPAASTTFICCSVPR
jgi:hypothetical protein